MSAVIGKIGGEVSRFGRGAGSALRDLDKISGKVADGFVKMAMAGGAGAVVLGAGLLKVATSGAGFEQAITNVGAVMGKNRGQIQELEKEAMRLGVVTQFSSSEVADAMEMMARKGFDSQEILQGIPGVLDAVAASGQGMAEVATVVGSAIRGFGLEASRASHVADLLAFTAEKTGATITDLGAALSIAGPTAKALGVSIEDTATAVGLLQKIGIDSSTSGSAVATMLAKISKPSKEVAAQMAAMGVKFKDAKGNMLPFREVLSQFVKAGDKAGGSMDRMAFFAELVGLRGDKAALGLSDMAKSGDFDKLAQGIEKVDGYAHKVASIRMDTTQGSWKLLTSTIEVLETKLFNLQSGPLRGVVDGVNKWVAANQDLIVSKVADFIKGIADNMPEIVLWATRIGKIAAVFLAVAAAVKVVTLAMGLFNLVSEANPWVLLALALVAAAALIYAFWPEISAFFKKLWGNIKSMASDVGAFFVRLWGSVVGALRTAWGAVTGFFSAIWNSIKGPVVAVLEFVVGVVTLYFNSVKAILGAVWSVVVAEVKIAVAIFQAVWAPIGAFFSLLWSGVTSAFRYAWSVVTLIATGTIEAFKAIWSPVADFFSGIWNGIGAVFSTVWDGIVAGAKLQYEAIMAVFAPLTEFFGGLWNGIAAAFKLTLGWVIDKISAMVNAVRSVGRGALGGDAPVAPADAPAPGGVTPGSQMVTPQDRVARTITETKTTNTDKVELTIKAPPGSVEVTKKPKGGRVPIALPNSGSL